MKKLRKIHIFVTVCWLIAALAGCGTPQEEAGTGTESSQDGSLVYVGTYTRGGESQGIYAYRFEPATGNLTSLGLAAEVRDPSFLAVHPNRRYLYAVSEIDDYEADGSGSVTAFEINHETGKLALLNVVSSEGGWPCHLNLDSSGRMLAVANYRGGSVAAFPVREDGRLGEASVVLENEGSSVNPQRQQQPHAHSVDFSPDDRFVVTADLGTDEVLIYAAEPETAMLEPNDPPLVKVKPGSGPRHFAFHPSGEYAYVINELLSTVTVFSYEAKRGVLEKLQTISTLPDNFSGENHTAEIAVLSSGEFVYGSNRGHDSIAVFGIDGQEGTLTPVQHASTQGETPRNFAIDPAGQYLFAANQNTDNIVVFRIDPQTGQLKPTGNQLEVPSPVCIKFVEAE